MPRLAVLEQATYADRVSAEAGRLAACLGGSVIVISASLLAWTAWVQHPEPSQIHFLNQQVVEQSTGAEVDRICCGRHF